MLNCTETYFLQVLQNFRWNEWFGLGNFEPLSENIILREGNQTRARYVCICYKWNCSYEDILLGIMATKFTTCRFKFLNCHRGHVFLIQFKDNIQNVAQTQKNLQACVSVPCSTPILPKKIVGCIESFYELNILFRLSSKSPRIELSWAENFFSVFTQPRFIL